ncbi:MAG: hypothetical protein ACRD19_01645 [Terriglobia bacterium]
MIEYSIDRPLRLEPVDKQHPNTVALLCGALTLFALNSPRSHFTNSQLLAAKQQGSLWKVQSATASVGFMSFPEIRDQRYRLYHEVEG